MGTCSVSCGKGDRTRTRKITTPSAGGMACPKSTETTKCVEKACPVDCKLSAWSDSNACTKTCGGGVERRYRRIVTAPMYGGKQCEDISPISQSASTTGPLEEELSCNANPCPTDCVTSKWSAWGSCSKTCGDKPPGTRLFGAKQERTRYIQTPASDDGVPCGSLVQQRLCALHPCGAQVRPQQVRYRKGYRACFPQGHRRRRCRSHQGLRLFRRLHVRPLKRSVFSFPLAIHVH